MEVRKEYERIKELYNGVDEKQLALIDGAIWECAKLRVNLNELNEVAAKSGLVKVNPANPTMQKELPVAKVLTRDRASYINYIAKLSSILGKNIEDDEDDLADFQ